MKLKDFFKIEYGQKEYTSKFFLEDKIGNIPLISSGANENGFFGMFDISPKYKRVISVARTGSVGWAFYHSYECCIDNNCLVLEPLSDMSDEQMIFLTLLINQDRYRYMYGRQVTPKRIGNIEIPEFPKYINNYKIPNVKTIEKPLKRTSLSLSGLKWKLFRLDSIFIVERGKCGSAEKLLEKGGEIDYIGAKKEDNGFMYRVKRDDKFITIGNCIVFIGDGQGSVGFSTYQEKDFIGSTTLSMGRSEKLNKYNGIFIISILDKERFKYSFGRKWNGDKLKSTQLRLPADEYGDPDWDFMESYIKSLPYSSSI